VSGKARTTLSTFEVVDKRGSNKPETATPVVEVKEHIIAQGSDEWKEVVYGIVVQQVASQQGPPAFIIMGRAFGLRGDGLPFCADFWFGAKWEEGFRWEPIAKDRLDTFLGCGCDHSSPCKDHDVWIRRWAHDDRKRIEEEGQTEPPEVIKIFIMAEQSRAKSMMERQQAQQALNMGLAKTRR